MYGYFDFLLLRNRAPTWKLCKPCLYRLTALHRIDRAKPVIHQDTYVVPSSNSCGCRTIRANTVQYAEHPGIPDSLGKESEKIKILELKLKTFVATEKQWSLWETVVPLRNSETTAITRSADLHRTNRGGPKKTLTFCGQGVIFVDTE